MESLPNLCEQVSSSNQSENIFYLVMNNGENRQNPEFCQHIHMCIDEMHKTPAEKLKGTALVTLSTHPKIFSTGLDIGNYKNPSEVAVSIHDLMQLSARFLALPIPSVILIDRRLLM